MKTQSILILSLLAARAAVTYGFVVQNLQTKPQMRIAPQLSLKMISSNSDAALSRRTMLSKVSFVSSMIIPLLSNPSLSFAEASVTTEEFEKILKDSYRSIQLVEFSGSKSETCNVKLIDGTTFSISDLVESPVDPRSPLKLQALCRGYNVPTKNLGLESALVSTPKRKKVYMNSRVQEAASKEAAKRERLRLDEEERLRALYLMEEEEAKKLIELEAKKAQAIQ